MKMKASQIAWTSVIVAIITAVTSIVNNYITTHNKVKEMNRVRLHSQHYMPAHPYAKMRYTIKGFVASTNKEKSHE